MIRFVAGPVVTRFRFRTEFSGFPNLECPLARKPSSSGSPRRSSSRRKPVTIDLEAKTVAKDEVKSDKADPASATEEVTQDEKAAQSDKKDKGAAAADTASARVESGPGKTESDSPSPGTSPEKATPGKRPEAKSTVAPEAKRGSEPPPKSDPKSEPKSKPKSGARPEPAARPTPAPSAGAKQAPRSSLPLIAAAAIGGVVTLGGAIGLDRAGVIRLGQEQSAETEALSELEASVAELSGALEGFRGDIEARINEFSAAAGDAETVQQQIDSLTAQIADIPSAEAPDLGPLQTRMSKMEALLESGGAGVDAGLEALQAKLSTAVTRIDALSENLNSLTEAGKARSADIDAGLEAMRASLDEMATETKALGQNLAALSEGGRARSAGIAAVEERLAGRIDAFESTLDELSARTDLAAARAEAAATADQLTAANEASMAAARKADQAVAIAPVLAVETLQRAMETGQPLESALNAFASLGVTDPVLDALQPYAKTGLPTLDHLKTEFDGLAAGFAATPTVTPTEGEAGAVDRLLKGAFRVVKVRPAEPGGPPDPAAAAFKVSGALAAGDLERALDEWQALPDDQKQASQAWADKASVIQDAQRFAERVRTDALARLNITQ